MTATLSVMMNLARKIEAEHKDATKAARDALKHAYRCGQLLIEAKQEIKHGEFLGWVGLHCHVGERQARRYMTLARGWEHISKTDSMSDLTLAMAGKLIAQARRKPQGPFFTSTPKPISTKPDAADVIDEPTDDIDLPPLANGVSYHRKGIDDTFALIEPSGPDYYVVSVSQEIGGTVTTRSKSATSAATIGITLSRAGFEPTGEWEVVEPVVAGPCPKGGDHQIVSDDEGQYCERCCDSADDIASDLERQVAKQFDIPVVMLKDAQKLQAVAPDLSERVLSGDLEMTAAMGQAQIPLTRWNIDEALSHFRVVMSDVEARWPADRMEFLAAMLIEIGEGIREQYETT